MTKIQLGSDVFDKLLQKVEIPVQDRITVYRDLKDKVFIVTLEAIDKLLTKNGT